MYASRDSHEDSGKWTAALPAKLHPLRCGLPRRSHEARVCGHLDFGSRPRAPEVGVHEGCISALEAGLLDADFPVAFIGPSLEIRRICRGPRPGSAPLQHGPRRIGSPGKLRPDHTQQEPQTCVVELQNCWKRHGLLLLHGLPGSSLGNNALGLNSRACFAGPVGRNVNLHAFGIHICNNELRTRAHERGAGPLGPAGFQRAVLPHPPLLRRPKDGRLSVLWQGCRAGGRRRGGTQGARDGAFRHAGGSSCLKKVH